MPCGGIAVFLLVSGDASSLERYVLLKLTQYLNGGKAVVLVMSRDIRSPERHSTLKLAQDLGGKHSSFLVHLRRYDLRRKRPSIEIDGVSRWEE
jgi:hypothetical protein